MAHRDFSRPGLRDVTNPPRTKARYMGTTPDREAGEEFGMLERQYSRPMDSWMGCLYGRSGSCCSAREAPPDEVGPLRPWPTGEPMASGAESPRVAESVSGR